MTKPKARTQDPTQLALGGSSGRMRLAGKEADMSKQDKHAQARSREDRDDRSEVDGEDHLEELAGAEELLQTGWLNKEIKIGLAVFAVLGIVVGVGWIQRMRRPTETPSRQSAEDQAKVEIKRFSGAEEPKRSSAAAESASLAGAGSSSKASPDTGAPRLDPKRSVTGDRGETWALASDRPSAGARKEPGGAFSPSGFGPSRSFPPPPDRVSGPAVGKATSSSTLSTPSTLSTNGWEADTDTAGRKADSRSTDPFQNRPSLGTRPLGGTGGWGGSGSDRLSGATDRGTTAPRWDSAMPPADTRTPSPAAGFNPLRGSDRGQEAPAITSATPRPNETGAPPAWNMSYPSPARGLAAGQSGSGPGMGPAAAGTTARTGSDSAAESSAGLSRGGLAPRFGQTPASGAGYRDQPDRSGLAATPSGSAGSRVYVVQEGETLYDIARHQLGNVARWSEIYDLNPSAIGRPLDPLTPGTRLVLPADRPENVSHRNGSGLPR